MTETTTEPVLRLERETCSRCGGSGHYSYCSMYGTRCFKCAGKKEVLSKRGAAAMAHLKTLRSKRAGDLKVGDRVWHDGLVVPGAVCDKGGWATVTEIRPGDAARDGGQIVGYTTDPVTGMTVGGTVVPPELVVETNRCKHQTTADRLFRVFVSKEREVETLKAAIAYQDTLTKTGKPRKRAAKG
jgi:hypothetical protein